VDEFAAFQAWKCFDGFAGLLPGEAQVSGHADISRKFGRADVEFLGEVFARMNGSDWHGSGGQTDKKFPFL